MTDNSGARTPIQAQSVDAPLSRSAVFLTLALSPHADAPARARALLGDLGGLVRAVGFRDLAQHLSCVVGIGATQWESITGLPRPAQLHPFEEIVGTKHTAVATPGDLFFHIRAERDDMCFELERLVLAKLGDAVTVVDETVGFRYFDARDLLGFVDGTENPTGAGMMEWTIVGDDDPAGAGGSYVVTQKYLHDLSAWNDIPIETQQKIIGRTKVDNLELDDAPGSHKNLATILDDDGVEHDILRDNMPFGRPGHGEFGTSFIGYSKDVWVIERMLQRMFRGDPPLGYDRILDVSRAVTGATFFAPSNDVLESFGD
jgi:putative iron-dependent peroxidase